MSPCKLPMRQPHVGWQTEKEEQVASSNRFKRDLKSRNRRTKAFGYDAVKASGLSLRLRLRPDL